MHLLEWLLVQLLAFYHGLRALWSLARLTLQFGFHPVFGQRTFAKPAVLDDPTLGTHGYLHLSEVRLHYVASGPEDKPLMLFLHGFPEFWFSWRHQIREFQKDFRVVAIDQRGYGDSSKPTGMDAYVMPKVVDDVRQVISALGYQSCVLVAHDFGGAVAWEFVSRFGSMVDQLIVLNAVAESSFRKVLLRNTRQLRMAWYMFFFQLPVLPEVFMRVLDFHFFEAVFGVAKSKSMESFPSFQRPVDIEEVDAYKYTFSQPNALTPPINWYRAAFRKDTPPSSPRVPPCMPALLVWGVNDFAAHIDLLHQMASDVQGLEVKRIERAGHFVHVDTPTLVNAAMREFLDRHQVQAQG